MLNFTITDLDHCRRTDSFLRNLLPAAPLSYLSKLVSSGNCRVNDMATATGYILRHGDKVSLKESTKTLLFLKTGRLPLDILFEDSWILSFNKPAGLPMHPAAEVHGRNLVDWGTELMHARGEEGKLRPVNRLDRGTSGAVLLAKSSSAAGMFGRFIKEEGLSKIYLAVVAGRPAPDGNIATPLKGKESATCYRLLFQGDGQALLGLFPMTGRMHQLRQHLSSIGHSILGDKRYGGAAVPGYTGHALHSFSTRFSHPASGEQICINAPLPANFLALIKQLTGPYASSLLESLPQLTEQ